MKQLIGLVTWSWVVVALALASAADAVTPEKDSERESVLTWTESAALPGGELQAGAFAGRSGAVFMVAGGKSESLENPQYHDEVYVLVGGGWYEAGSLPAGRAFGAAVGTDNGLICVGGVGEGQECLPEVLRLSWDTETKRLTVETLPALPTGVALAAAAVTGDRLYVAGGVTILDGEALGEQFFWSLGLSETNGDWWEEAALPGDGRCAAMLAAQHDGYGVKLFLMGGASSYAGSVPAADRHDCYAFDPAATDAEQAWEKIADLPTQVQATAVPVGSSHVFLLGGGEERAIWAYHGITDTWAAMGNTPDGVEATLVADDGGVVRVLDRAGKGYEATTVLKESRFRAVDYATLVVYLGALVVMGFYFSKREKTTEDFFLGGRRVPWWAVGLSLIGTGLSAITYIATPAKAYATNWVYYTPTLLFPLAILVQAYVALPFFRRLNVTTSYEYLEKRFNIVVRLFGSISYIVLQLGRMGIVLYLPAIALSAATGMDKYFCILVMGILCTLYTVLGGIEAVIWTDVIQVIVFYAGAIIMLVIVFASLDNGFATFVEVGRAEGKFHMINWGMDLRTTSLLVVILGYPAAMFIPMTDQTTIQRWLTTPDERGARKAIWTGFALGAPAGLMFFTIGAAIYVFYKTHPEKLNPVLMNDGIVPWFAVQQLPAGVAGFLIAAIFAASMSSMDSSMNSLSTAVVTDFYRRFKDARDEEYCLKLARWLTVLFGVFGTVMALLFATTDIKSLVDVISEFNGLFGGGLAGVFLLGMMTKHCNAKGAIVGIVCSAAAVYAVKSYTGAHFFLYFIVGQITCMVTGYVASLLMGGNPNLTDGLNIYTLAKEQRRA